MESWVEQRVLQFFNQARTLEDITESPLLKDDPAKGSEGGYVIGTTVGQRILDKRNAIPGRRFRELGQLMTIKGLGEDKLHDLKTSLAIPADTFFRNRLFDGILFDNWVVEPRRTTYETEEDFKQASGTSCGIKQVVAEQIYNTLTPFPPQELRLQHLSIQNAYLERWEDSEIGAINFATWWYLFDYDNWFSFERIREVCAEYLSYHRQGDNKLELFILRGVALPWMMPTQRTNMIPVIVNYAEHVITTWNVVLND